MAACLSVCLGVNNPRRNIENSTKNKRVAPPLLEHNTLVWPPPPHPLLALSTENRLAEPPSPPPRRHPRQSIHTLYTSRLSPRHAIALLLILNHLSKCAHMLSVQCLGIHSGYFSPRGWTAHLWFVQRCTSLWMQSTINNPGSSRKKTTWRLIPWWLKTYVLQSI